MKIKYVKYNKKQIKAAKEDLLSKAQSLGIEGVGVSPSKNKVNVYINDENKKKYEKEILKNANEDMIEWVVGDFRIKDNAYNLFAGERIERYMDGNQWGACSLGFNARAAGNAVGVTAGHCLNGTYHDLSDGSASIGTMSNAKNGSSYNIDGGYIKYVAGVNPSVYLNGNALTIAATDYAGTYREENDSVKIHPTSLNGSSTKLLKILDNDLSLPGLSQHLVRTTLGDAPLVGGDSGALVYSVGYNGTKYYARIEGVYKGNFTDDNVPIGEVFSQYNNLVDGLGLTGAYVDTTITP